MQFFKEDIVEIYKKEKGIMVFMILNLILSIALLIYSMISLSPEASVVKTGYSDISGYRDGVWTDIISFSLLALNFGILHNILTVRIFHKRGSGMSKLFLIITTILILGSILVLARLLGGG